MLSRSGLNSMSVMLVLLFGPAPPPQTCHVDRSSSRKAAVPTGEATRTCEPVWPGRKAEKLPTQYFVLIGAIGHTVGNPT